jgi:hypothetical protein
MVREEGLSVNSFGFRVQGRIASQDFQSGVVEWYFNRRAELESWRVHEILKRQWKARYAMLHPPYRLP